MNNDYEIDFELFNVSEVIKILDFYKLIESTKTKKVNSDILVSKYYEYINIINNKALVKKYEKMFYKKTSISIYKLIKPLIK